MHRSLEIASAFRARLAAGERLVGTFVKSGSSAVVEVLGGIGLDFVVLDAEHAPYGRAEIDRLLLAACASGLPALVRVPAGDAGAIDNALDCGAAGIVAPHIRNADDARALLAACRYRGGTRGFSNSPRAGGYGRANLRDHVASSDANVCVIGQIEDMAALDALDAIMDVPLDAVFIGRADLAVSGGADSLAAPAVGAAVDRICSAARQARRAVAVFLLDRRQAAELQRLGASALVIGSDLAWVAAAATSQMQGPEESH
ncbi:HpcH/HpaI aldolase/citrate lyase family protein [Variovorax sp. KK3]|uniref:HpcH/HpaI aldolase family protein n=1 Tax=Variovorax sp. KK3 TaxID=1855728 RepID=UPI00097CAA81|nr:aldolase/citrate lyase family protein [Variovorax sp. KK3]